MNFEECFELINQFFKDDIILNKVSDCSVSILLENQKKCKFPKELKEYIDTVAGIKPIYFEGVGNPITLLSRKEFSWKMLGYNFNPVTNEEITGWNDNWFLIADEGGDPIVIDLSENEETCRVYKAVHGVGDWQFTEIADSIAQFIVCASAIHHAMCGFKVNDPISDDNNGFNLVKKPAKWLFPFIRKHAFFYYDEWVSVFDNS